MQSFIILFRKNFEVAETLECICCLSNFSWYQKNMFDCFRSENKKVEITVFCVECFWTAVVLLRQSKGNRNTECCSNL